MRLNDLSTEFKNWRLNGRLGQKVPLSLRAKAIELLGSYNISEILKVLRINLKTFNSWRDDSKISDSVFIALEPEKEILLSRENLSLKISNGNWSLEGNISLENWQNAIKLLELVR